MQPEIIIVGGGFGGLYAARALGSLPVHITLVDRKNHHTFQPLLYQVATAGLSPADIAGPIRRILRKYRNVEVLLGEVTGIDPQRRRVALRDGIELGYDYLVLAAGATHAYFGHDGWAPFAPGLKTIEDALEIRRRILLAYELAERQAALGASHEPLHFVVVGGGPTGVELAGTLAGMAHKSLPADFRNIDPHRTRISLIEAGPRILPTYPEDLSRSAAEQLRRLGVEVRTNAMVTSVEPDQVRVGPEAIRSAVTLWAAGVSASPLGAMLGAPLDKAGRVLVEPDLSVPGHPEIFVIGDLAAARNPDGNPIPGVAPAAIQGGRAVAATIARDLRGEPRVPFYYKHRGSLAVIGRKAGIADFGRLKLRGLAAWLSWLFVHLLFLIGFRNRLLVLTQWAWSYFTYDRAARLITGSTDLPSSRPEAAAQSETPHRAA
jgi:NADH:ubiquinone reductase (H+-translocating)